MEFALAEGTSDVCDAHLVEQLSMKIAPTAVMADDGGVSNVVPLLRHHRCSLPHHARDASRETLDPGLPDQTMAASHCRFPSCGHHFGASVCWMAQEEEQCYIYRKADDGSREHGAAEFRRRARVDGYVQDGGVV